MDSLSATYTVSAAGNRHILSSRAAIVVNDGNGMTVAAGATGNTLRIDGQILARGDNHGIRSFADDTTVRITADGSVRGVDGVTVTGNNARIVNDGHVAGAGAGLVVGGTAGSITNNGTVTGLMYGITLVDFNAESFTIRNNGTVAAETGMFLAGMDVTVELGAGSVIRGGAFGIAASTTLGASIDVTNAGRILVAGGTAINGVDGGDDRIVNSGRIVGDVTLRGGNDTFIDRGGSVAGRVDGGRGDDSYVLKSGLDVFEGANGGYDTVKAAVSYSLQGRGEIEALRLTGKKNIEAIGNALDNVLTGNKGDNRIDGSAGDDMLTGGKGRDVFVFAALNGTDTIADFEQGRDRIEIEGFDVFNRFKDLDIRQEGRDVVIDFSAERAGDMLVIENARVKDFDKGDFIFV